MSETLHGCPVRLPPKRNPQLAKVGISLKKGPLGDGDGMCLIRGIYVVKFGAMGYYHFHGRQLYRAPKGLQAEKTSAEVESGLIHPEQNQVRGRVGPKSGRRPHWGHIIQVA